MFAVLLLIAAVAADDATVLNFPGPPSVNDYIAFDPAFPEYLTALSGCAWIFPDYSDHASRYYLSFATSKSTNQIILGDTGGKFAMWLSSNSLLSNKLISKSQWSHVCFTWSSQEGAVIYINGELDNTDDNMGKGKQVYGVGTLVIGQEQDAVGGRFEAEQAWVGKLFQLNAWNRTLSADEVADMYDSGFCGDVDSAGMLLSYKEILQQNFTGAIMEENSRCKIEPLAGFGTVLRTPLKVSTHDYVEVHAARSAGFKQLSALTVCTWIFKTYTDMSRYFFSYANEKSDNAILIGDNSKGLSFYLHSARVETGEALPLQTWTHLCFSWDNSVGASIYLNGEEAATKAGLEAGAVVEGGGIFNLGQDQDIVGGKYDVNQAFSGSYYNLNLFGRALSAQEVSDMYNQGFCALVDDNLTEDVLLSWDTISSLSPSGASVFDKSGEAWLHGSPSCAQEEEPTPEEEESAAECEWEVLDGMRDAAEDVGEIVGLERAKEVCRGMSDCVSLTCNTKETCWLKKGEHKLSKKKGQVTYKLHCNIAES